MLTYVRTLRFIWLLSAILLHVQCVALLHGVQHPFHIPDYHCKAYEVLGHQGHAVYSADLPLIVLFVHEQPIRSFKSFVLSVLTRPFWARAPPIP